MKSNYSPFIEEIFKLSRAIRDRMSYNPHYSQLSVLQFQTLLFLKKKKQVGMTEVAQRFNIELPSATSLINKLVKSGFVVRKNDREDRRVVLVELSKKGIEMGDMLAREHNKTLNKIFSYLSEKDQRELLRILSKLNQTLDTYEK